MFKRALVAAVFFAFSLQAVAEQEVSANRLLSDVSWEQILKDNKIKKFPTANETFKPVAKPTGGYELYKVADRWGFLIDPQGYPLVVFDYTLENFNLWRGLFGAVGIGSFSLNHFWKKYKKAKEKDYLKFSEDQEENSTAPYTEDDVKAGVAEFATWEFRDSWLMANGHAEALKEGKHSGFKPATFTMADFNISADKVDKMYPAIKEMAIILSGVELDKKDTLKFLEQFKMEWNEQAKEFNMLYEPNSELEAMKKEKPPKMPSWVLNYMNPLDILAYKYSLRNLERNAMGLDALIGKYAKILALIVARMSNELKARHDAHENMFQFFVEAANRGEVTFEMPLLNKKVFIDTTVEMLYLNKVIPTDDVTDGAAKREWAQREEQISIKKNFAWAQKKGYEVKMWKDGRTATIFKDGKRKGIMSLAMKPKFITKIPSMHVYDKAPAYKSAYRIGLEAFTIAFRWVIPEATNIRLSSSFYLSLYIPGGVWDLLLRGRSFNEVAYEGFLISQVNEAMRGEWVKEVPGYAANELPELREHLYKQRQNPFEIPAKYEAQGIVYNEQLVKDLIGANQVDAKHFRMYLK